MATSTSTGLPKADQPRYHFDLYAVLEAPQELYFGHETQVNVNIVETVRIATDNEVIEKCYLSPTKRRGVERRSLIWAPIQSEGVLLGDKRGCGIPHTCSQVDCPICSVYGGLIPSKTTVDVLDGTETRNPITMIGRLVHGGGVAVQRLEPSEKQRAMHPSMLHKQPEAQPTPTPFKREYNEPALLYPVYNHCLSITDGEFQSVAYAFLDSLSRLGAGNPKGVRIYEAEVVGEKQPLLVLDRYLVPLGARPVLSPALETVEDAIVDFRKAATQVHGKEVQSGYHSELHETKPIFERWTGSEALVKLQEYATNFAINHLL